MDFSAWDEKNLFTLEEIAYLLAGADPQGEEHSALTEKKVAIHARLLNKAVLAARKHAEKYLFEFDGSHDFIAPDIFEFDAWGGELPSFQLRNDIAACLGSSVSHPKLPERRLGEVELFCRDDIEIWASSKGLIGGYSFSGDSEASPQEGLWLEEMNLAFVSQLEILLDRYWEYADTLLKDRDVSRLNSIGYWQRIVMLDRMESGEDFLSPSDIAAIQGTKLGYVLDEDQANVDWRAASQEEKWIAFGIHAYCRIISGQADAEESFFLFGLATEVLASLQYGAPETKREQVLSDLARHAANTLHSKPGGSREKRDAIRQAWASGKYSSRDICAEQECAALGMSFSTARKALRGTPDPG